MAAELQRMEHSGDAPATGVASNMGAADGTFTVLSGTGYPTGAVGPFIIVVDPGTASEEKILCASRSGVTFTVAGSGRGFDGTSATTHSTGTTNVQHVLGAIEVDDTNRHVYTTTDDDHTQYLRVNGARASTGAQAFSAGLSSASGLTVSAGTSALQAVTATTVTASSTITATGSAVTGDLFSSTGVGLNSGVGRFVGSSLAGGPPSSGTWAQYDFCVDFKYGIMWVCNTAGTPGTWNPIGGGNIYSIVYRNTAWTTASAGAQIAFDTAVSDPNTLTNLSTGTFTAPVAGIYHVTAQFRYTSSATTQDGVCTVIQNATNVATSNVGVNESGGGAGWAPASQYLNCAVNDTIKINNQTSTNALTGTTGQANTYMSVRLVS